jgi:chromosome segregation ATPase
MFEADTRAAVAKTRSSVLRVFEAATTKAVKPLSAVPGTVYGEMKLSDRLMSELTDLREAMRQLETQMTDALQTKTTALQELNNANYKLKVVSGGLELLRHQFDTLQRATDQSELYKALVYNQLQELKIGFIQCEKDKHQLTTELHEERALNDKYKNKATELEHRNSLLQMENDVIGERLKGLYVAFESILGKNSFEEKIRQEFKDASLASASLAGFIDHLDRGLLKTCSERDQLKDDFNEAVKYRIEMKSDRDKLFTRLKKDGTKWETEFKRVDEERNKMQSDYTELEKQSKILSEEQDKTRQKLKQMRIKRRAFGEMEEKVCRSCGRTYYDNENYNWSCRIHFSQYGGELWWCCGKQGQNAPGCKLSKHECREDEDDEEEEQGKMKTACVKCAVRTT